MRAVVVNEINNRNAVLVTDTDAPILGPEHVLIDAVSASFNFPDVLQIDGKYQIIPPLPFIPGKEAAGVVTNVGPAVTEFDVGDRVLVEVEYGAFAEQVAAPVQRVYRLPDELDMSTAAAMGLVYQTAYIALTDRAGLRKGDTVLVTGATGGVGLAAVQIAKAMGATVLAAIGNPAKADAARAAGADHVVNLFEEPLADRLREQVNVATNSRGVDIVLDVVGGDVFDAALRCIAFGGRIVVLGFTAGRIPSLKTNYVLLKNIAVVGMTVNGYFQHRPDTVRVAQDAIFALWKDGQLQPVIHTELALDDFADGFKMLDEREAIGKIVLAIR
ncbi:MAG: NADPH:quinone oxidoreductase family protein [Gammaproteobacteria bacterium]|nr:NADPH:quinone oxidoreductase family protein [Gammaproteobacteria bacterium]MDH3466521.1 NADPH:quinone oxidoreductase family protein [Gammaproteobacteria bacterium]